MQVGTIALLYHPSNGFLVGKRGKGCKNGAGYYAFPGGKRDDGETIYQCVRREVREETGYRETDFNFLGFVDLYDEKKIDKVVFVYSLELSFLAKDPINVEPEKCEGWEWKQFFDLKKIYYSSDEQQRWIPWSILGMIDRKLWRRYY